MTALFVDIDNDSIVQIKNQINQIRISFDVRRI